MSKLQTVVELPEFIKRAKALMSGDDRMALINMLAAMPDTGVSLGGGLRKICFAREGSGKREITELFTSLVGDICLCSC